MILLSELYIIVSLTQSLAHFIIVLIIIIQVLLYHKFQEEYFITFFIIILIFTDKKTIDLALAQRIP